MFDAKSLKPEQVELLKKYIQNSIQILTDINELSGALEETARELTVELGMDPDDSHILLSAAYKAYSEQCVREAE